MRVEPRGSFPLIAFLNELRIVGLFNILRTNTLKHVTEKVELFINFSICGNRLVAPRGLRY